MNNKKDFDYERASNADFRDGYNKGRKDMAIESLGIFALCVFIGWVFL